MEDHIKGRDHFMKVLEDGKRDNSFVVSLGDLGESKSVDETKQLFAGTSGCFKLAREYLDGFKTPFDIVGGNHDLEGIDEFPTDEANMEAYLAAFDKKTPQFRHEIADKVVLVGLGSTVFREAVYTSHEVFIDDEQVAWFEETIKACPAEEGWRVFVFTHAPPMGSGLRVLQENHVVNGCCWLNHSSKNTAKFINIVRENPSIKAWFSGHFHLGQDYQDSITFPDGSKRGSCVFAQTAVMAEKSSRDTRRQSRLIRGNKDGFTISTINHSKEGEERLDATITYTDNTRESIVYALQRYPQTVASYPRQQRWLHHLHH
jgi:predicted phosphodiesterase